jgi:hypothetical protein
MLQAAPHDHCDFAIVRMAMTLVRVVVVYVWMRVCVWGGGGSMVCGAWHTTLVGGACTCKTVSAQMKLILTVASAGVFVRAHAQLRR